MSSELDCIIQDFLVESYENLDQLDQALVALESDPHPQERLASIFRAVHTIKGTCGFLGFSHLEKLSHVGENLLCRLRDGSLSPTPTITNALLQMLDSIREILGHIETNGQEGDAAYQELVDTLDRLQNPATDCGGERINSPSAASKDLPSRVVAAGEQQTRDVERQASAGSVADMAVRVDVRLLDKLMVLVGELVLVRNRMQQHAGHLGNSPLLSSSQRLSLITTELQEAVMKTRMQPIGSIWSKFPRIVRDLSLACGKQVAIEMEGLETELDKTLIEAVKDPFTHLVRNAIDHGIETPETRVARGKPPRGGIWLRAYHEGGQVNIDVVDDGAGISPDHIKRKAIERGLISSDQALLLSDHEAIQLIFCPGFSTAETITNVSGRGVGMDVVKANIERIGGTIDVNSQTGIGTTIRIKIPLTLAIIPALLIGHEGTRFAIPQVNLLELVRLDGQTAPGIEFVHGAPVYRLRGKLLPLVDLGTELRLNNSLSPLKQRAVPQTRNILVLQADNRRFGLIVNEIYDSAEIVVKPLDKRLHGIRAYAGATILGDGKLALILDVINIAKSVGLLADSARGLLPGEGSSPSSLGSPAEEHFGGRPKSTNEHPQAPHKAESETLLIFEADNGSRMAIPLSSVTRLEEVPVHQIERSGNHWVLQYRGQILPLVNIAEALGESSRRDFRPDAEINPDQCVPVVVCNDQYHPCGFIVERIVDIVEQDVDVRGEPSRPAIQHTLIVQGRVTELIDITALMRIVTSQRPLAQTI